LNHARLFGLGIVLTVLIFSASPRPAYAGCPGLGAPGSAGDALTGVLYDPIAGVMKACVGNNWVSLGNGGGGGASTLSGLSDVSVTGIADGKSLVYNGTSSKWEPQTLSGGGVTSLSGLNDVDLSALGNGKALVYNSSASKWTAQTISGGSGVTVAGTTGKIAKFTGGSAVSDSVITESNNNVGIGTDTPNATLEVSGSILTSGQNTDDARLELGSDRTGNGNAYIDLHGDATYTDYGLRIIRNGSGANASSNITHRGTGSLGIVTEDAANISFATSNETRMLISSTGKVGVGTITPSNQLTVGGGLEFSSSAFTAGGSGAGVWMPGAGELGLVAGGATAVRINASGNVGIGTPSPTVRLNVGPSAAALDANETFQVRSTGTVNYGTIRTAGNTLYLGAVDGGSDGFIGTFSNTNFALRTAAADRLVISNSGNVGIGTTSPTAGKLQIGNTTANIAAIQAFSSGSGGGDGMWLGSSTAAGRVLALHKVGGTGNILEAWYDGGGGYAQRLTLNNAGAMWIAGALTQNSDGRLKKNISPVPSALGGIAKLRGVSFEWTDKTRESGRQLGVIAQDVQSVFPELVTTGKDGMLSVNYLGLTAPLIEAVKELKADNDNLRAQLREITTIQNAEIEKIRREVRALKAVP
jgi:hypothetical protein